MSKVKIKKREVSDVIVVYTGSRTYYENLMTGKSSLYLKNIIRNRRFIVFITNIIENIRGYYVRHIKENDTLIILLMKLKKTGHRHVWEEESRVIISRDGSRYSMDSKDDICAYSGIDICGQVVYNGVERFHNISISGREAFLSFFGGPAYYADKIDRVPEGFSYYKLYAYSINEFSCLTGDFLLKCIGFGQPENSGFGIIDYSGDRGLLPPLPNEAYRAMERVGKAAFDNDISLSRYKNCCILMPARRACCLQKFNGTVYLRNFVLCVQPGFDRKKMQSTAEILPVEYNTVKLPGSHVLFDNPSHIIFYAADNEPVLLAWCDDLSGTPMQYVQNIIHDAVAYIKNNLGCRYVLDRNYFKILCDSYEYPADLCIKAACWCADSAVIEKLFNIPLFRQHILMHLDKPMEEYVEYFYGGVDESKGKLHACLGISKPMLDLAMHKKIPFKEVPFVIKTVKELFDSSPQYLQSMNREESESVLAAINDPYVDLSVVHALIDIYGPSKWHGFVKWSIKVRNMQLSLEYYMAYREYYKKLQVIGDAAKDAPWKVMPVEIEKAEQLIEQAYLDTVDKQYSAYCEKFQEYASVWGRYCYENGAYLIKAPKSPSEIVAEGMRLHHCAKDFIQKVSSGETTILFIRRKEAPDKPYFTLEVKDGAIRQCHGHSNCCAGEEIYQFLKGFCEEKGIVYSDGNMLYGAEH